MAIGNGEDSGCPGRKNPLLINIQYYLTTACRSERNPGRMINYDEGK